MLSSLKRALMCPKELRNPEVFTVPHSFPPRPISSSFLQKAYSKACNFLHICTSSLQDSREQHYCWVHIVPHPQNPPSSQHSLQAGKEEKN